MTDRSSSTLRFEGRFGRFGSALPHVLLWFRFGRTEGGMHDHVAETAMQRPPNMDTHPCIDHAAKTITKIRAWTIPTWINTSSTTLFVAWLYPRASKLTKDKRSVQPRLHSRLRDCYCASAALSLPFPACENLHRRKMFSPKSDQGPHSKQSWTSSLLMPRDEFDV